jgi:hypothetical protein
MANILGRTGKNLTPQQKVGYYLTRLAKTQYNKETHSEPTFMFKLVEIIRETYSSKGEAGRKLFNHNRGIRLHEGEINDYTQKKIPFALDKFGRMIRIKATGNKIGYKNRDEGVEVCVYELIPELISYKKGKHVFPSVREIERYFENKGEKIPAIRKVLSNEIYQSMGYFFTRDENFVLAKTEKIKKSKKNYQNIIVKKIIEKKTKKIWNSLGSALKDLFDVKRSKFEKRMNVVISNDTINYQKESKIIFYEDKDGNKWRFKYTGKETPVWPGSKKMCKEVIGYLLEEEIVPYSNIQTEFPDIEEIVNNFNKPNLNVLGVIKGKNYHSFGLRFYKLN